MKNDSKKNLKEISSRREFLRLSAAGAGALTGLAVAPADAQLAARSADIPGAAPAGTSGAWSVVADHQGKVQSIHQTISLNGRWSVAALPLEAKGESGYNAFIRSNAEQLAAEVPGEIHLDLIRAGRLEDPNVSDNAKTRCRWPEQHSWWYRTEFTRPPGFERHLRQRLIFDGIDLYGQIFLNGHLIATTQNAFTTVAVDVNEFLREGINELIVRVTSGLELIPPEASGEPRKGEFWTGLRKPAYNTYQGFDFCPALPNIGIWQGVRLEGRSGVVIDHMRLDTTLHNKEVMLEGEIVLEGVHPWNEVPCIVELHLAPPQGAPTVWRRAIGGFVGRSFVPCHITIPDPQLWWPNGMGAQPLYQLTVRVLCGEEETDRHVQTIGLRTLELDRSPLAEGVRLGFKVNGEPVFCKGGDWAPVDLIPARADAARYQRLIAEAKNAHFTMFRVNGVGVYGSDAFYEACDRAGILVWQDFMFSVAIYPDRDPQFRAQVREEAEGLVKRLRHHPSLALWCGGNETHLLITLKTHDPEDAEKTGGVRLYNALLPEICRAYDPARPYRPSSPIGGHTFADGTSGDTHGPYGNLVFDTSGHAILALDPNDPRRLEMVDQNQRQWQTRADQMPTRFASEFAALGPPHISSIREYLKPEEFSRESVGWQLHTNQFDGKEGRDGAVATGIRYHYGEPRALSIPQFVLYGQMFQAHLLGTFIEARRFHKNDPQNDCQGVLNWSYNDTWGEIGWSIIDYYLRRKASYYAFRRACAPVKVLVRSQGTDLTVRVVNDTLRAYRASVRCGWVRLDGSAAQWRSHAVSIPRNGAIEVTRTSRRLPAGRSPREWLYAAVLTGPDLADDQALWLLAPQRELALAKPEVSVKVRENMLEVSSPIYCHGVHLDDAGHEVLADNYFDLLPGVPRRVALTAPSPSGTYPLIAVMPVS